MLLLNFTFVWRVNATDSQVVYVYERCATRTPTRPPGLLPVPAKSPPKFPPKLFTCSPDYFWYYADWELELSGIVGAALPLHCHGCCPVFCLFVLQCLGPQRLLLPPLAPLFGACRVHSGCKFVLRSLPNYHLA